jgi:hypothetical protein
VKVIVVIFFVLLARIWRSILLLPIEVIRLFLFCELALAVVSVKTFLSILSLPNRILNGLPCATVFAIKWSRLSVFKERQVVFIKYGRSLAYWSGPDPGAGLQQAEVRARWHGDCAAKLLWALCVENGGYPTMWRHFVINNWVMVDVWRQSGDFGSDSVRSIGAFCHDHGCDCRKVAPPPWVCCDIGRHNGQRESMLYSFDVSMKAIAKLLRIGILHAR